MLDHPAYCCRSNGDMYRAILEMLEWRNWCNVMPSQPRDALTPNARSVERWQGAGCRTLGKISPIIEGEVFENSARMF